jgi:hypothetical protein
VRGVEIVGYRYWPLLQGDPLGMSVEDLRSSHELREPSVNRARAFLHRYFFIFIPLLLLLQGSVADINLPGLYMDAVNPDYIIVRLLNWNPHIFAWVLPGTCIFNIFPTIQLYYGSLPYYIGMPVYILLGTGVTAVRIANFIFAALVLSSAAVFLQAFRVRPLIAGFALAALALDPGFLFSFRTQFYITLLPIALVLVSVSCVENGGVSLPRRMSAVAGLLIGLSIYGYFIYLFLAPAAAAHLWRNVRPSADRRSQLACWFAGFALGVSPYPLGFALMFFATGGLQGFERFLTDSLQNLSVESSKLSPWQSLQYFVRHVDGMTRFDGPSQMMLKESYLPFFKNTKHGLLLIIPIIYLIASFFFGRDRAGIRLISMFFLGMAFLFVIFGDRLWAHHVALTLPLLYLSLALAIEYLGKARPFVGRATWALTLPLLILAIGNAIDRQRLMLDLERTGGVGLASDAIERFAQDSLSNPDPTFAFFPDWGIFMPFEMVTGGRISLVADFSPDAARRKLCQGSDALLAIVNDKGVERLAPWIDAVGWGSPEVVVYRQRDDAPVLTSVRWRASAPTHPACVS